MIANTSRMHKIQTNLKDLLETEKMIYDMFSGLVEVNCMDIDKLEELREKVQDKNFLSKEIEILSKEDIMSNPYLQNIKIPNVGKNNVLLSKKRIVRRNSLMLYREKKRDIDTLHQINSYCYCEDNLRFPGIVEGDTKICWMTVEPQEMISFDNFIKEAKGNVLLCGCGLGYVAYMLSLKEDVESVIIVEINPDIISLFEEHIHPQFENSEKVKVVEADAIEFLKTRDLSEYDYINIDIWRGIIDMLGTYLKCLKIESKNKNIHFSYWLEEELKEVIQSDILKYIAGLDVTSEFFKSIVKDIVEREPINSLEDIKRIIKFDNFREIMLDWYNRNYDRVDELCEINNQKMQKILNFSKKISQ